MNKYQRTIEVLLVTSLLALGFFVGSFASRHFYGRPLFYQAEFGPAVMVAAGRGFVNPVAPPGSPLAEFLDLRRSSLDRADVVQVPADNKFDQFQEANRYLMLAVGYSWRLSGISWAGVSDVAALFYALTVVACYAICRVWVSRPLAVLGAVFICFSPLHLSQVPHLRDYSKAPFILLAALLVVVLSVRPLSRRLLVLLSAACGVVVGIGLGFRMDVVIMAPIFLLSLCAFRDRRPWTGLGEKGLASAVFLLALMIAGGPVLFRLSSSGSNGFHVILLGYADPFDASLGVHRAVYSFLPFYDDGYVVMAVRSFGARFSGQFPSLLSLTYASAGYDVISRAYWLAIVRHFPADILTRALAATNGIMNLPFNEPALNFLTAPGDHANPLWTLLTNGVPHRARVGAAFEWLTILHGWGGVFGLVLVGVAGVQRARLGVFAAWMVAALTGYSSLQFAGRHFFHLEVIPVLGVLVAIDLLVRRRWPGWRAAGRFAVAIVALTLTTTASVAALRAYQRVHLRRVFQQYIDAPRQPVQPVFTDTGDGSWRARWSTPFGRTATRGELVADYYVVEFDGPPTPERSALGFRYKAASPENNYSRVVSMQVDAGVNRVFVPAYTETGVWGFDGLDLPASIKDRLRGIYRVTRPEQLPLLLDLRLSAAWRQDALNQTLRLGDSGFADDIQLLGSTTGPTTSHVALFGRTELPDTRPSPDAVGHVYTKAVRVTGDGIEMDGVADAQSSYLVGFKPVVVNAPAVLIVRGHLYTGGVAFGLLKDDRWYRTVITGTPGDFVAVVDIPDSGTYVPIVTNATGRDHDRNRFVLSRFGIVTTSPAQP